MSELKSVFFVKDFKGDPGYTARRFEESDRPTGRKVEVTFYDGEVIVGATMGYDPKRIGFFVIIPADSQQSEGLCCEQSSKAVPLSLINFSVSGVFRDKRSGARVLPVISPGKSLDFTVEFR